MRYVIILLIFLIPILGQAKIDPEYVNQLTLNETTTLKQLSSAIFIPFKKLIECLKLENDIQHEQTLSELGIGKKEIIAAIEYYNENRFGYYQSIVGLGMFIVFFSLLITAFFIGLLQHVNFDYKGVKKNKKPKQMLNRTIGTMQVSSNAIVAAITTVYLHEMEVEEQNNMMLTWKRAPISLWKVSRILPNQEFYKRRGSNEKI
jgi:Na+-transporting methylmalonyl-CoA/oxaloacetate decarboxylase gamma subunit